MSRGRRPKNQSDGPSLLTRSRPLTSVPPRPVRTRKLLLDEMLAERARPPLPPAPVLTGRARVGRCRPDRRPARRPQALGRGRGAGAPQPARRRRGAPRCVPGAGAARRGGGGPHRRRAHRCPRFAVRSSGCAPTEEQRAAQARFAAAHEARVGARDRDRARPGRARTGRRRARPHARDALRSRQPPR